MRGGAGAQNGGEAFYGLNKGQTGISGEHAGARGGGGGEKPFHAVINAENFHALQALLYTHEGKIDGIYIDPPYNSGARDWKYNNHFVDADDLYRHSTWLAFMERRLLLAKKLLYLEASVLIVTLNERGID